MKKHLALAIAALVAIVAATGCFSQTTPKKGSTAQGITSPRDPASGLPTGH
jgi:hypothetical protein